MSTWYLDTSAFIKLVLVEPETDALRSHLGGHGLVSAALVRTEALRAVRRFDDGLLPRCRLALDRLDALIEIDQMLLTAAGTLDPPGLRSLDAIHLAACLALGADAEGMVTYDERLAAAALAAGVRVEQPA